MNRKSNPLAVPRSWIEAGIKPIAKKGGSQPSSNITNAGTNSVLSRKSSVRSRTNTIQARVDMSAEIAGQGLCPACKTPMEPMLANGHSVLVCMDDRIALPVKD